LGSSLINQMIQRLRAPLTEKFQVVHLCGQGKTEHYGVDHANYRAFDYVAAELPDLFACTDLVVSRAGSTAIFELLALQKPHILLPLSKQASRGDQIQNATYFAQQGLSTVLYAEQLSTESLLNTIFSVYSELPARKKKLAQVTLPDSSQLIVEKLLSFL